MCDSQLFSLYRHLIDFKEFLDTTNAREHSIRLAISVCESNQQACIDLIRFLKNANELVDVSNLTDEDDIQLGEQFVIDITIFYGNKRIYVDVEHYLENHNLSDMPDELLFIEPLSFYQKGSTKYVNKQLDLIDNVRTVVNKLSRLADFTVSESDKSNKLIFIDKDDSKYHLSISTRCKADILSLEPIENTLLDSLFKTDTDFSKKEKFIFRNSLIEFLRDKREKDYLITTLKEWRKFEHLFECNLQSYFNDFSFNKNLQKIANESLKIAEHLSKSSSEIMMKMLSIPASFIIVFGFFEKANEVSLLFLVGSFLATAFSTYILFNSINLHYQNALLQIRQKRNVFNQFKTGSNDESKKLQYKLRQSKKDVHNLIKSSLQMLRVYKFLSFSPLIIWCFFLLYHLYTGEVTINFILYLLAIFVPSC